MHLTGELRVNEALTGQLTAQIDKMREELRECKQIIKVPRIHYKYLERLEYEKLLAVKREVNGETMMTTKNERNIKTNTCITRKTRQDLTIE